jgi:hypothetical protein
VTSAQLSNSSEAISANYNWLKRDLDNILAPTEGYAWSLQGGVGYGRGVETRHRRRRRGSSRDPFVRAYTPLHLVPAVRPLVRQRPARSGRGVS